MARSSAFASTQFFISLSEDISLNFAFKCNAPRPMHDDILVSVILYVKCTRSHALFYKMNLPLMAFARSSSPLSRHLPHVERFVNTNWFKSQDIVMSRLAATAWVNRNALILVKCQMATQLDVVVTNEDVGLWSNETVTRVHATEALKSYRPLPSCMPSGPLPRKLAIDDYYRRVNSSRLSIGQKMRHSRRDIILRWIYAGLMPCYARMILTLIGDCL